MARSVAQDRESSPQAVVVFSGHSPPPHRPVRPRQIGINPRSAVRVNVLGGVLASKLAIPQMLAQGCGRRFEFVFFQPV